MTLSSKTGTALSNNHFSGGGTPWFTPFRGSDPMCDFNIFKLHQNEDLCKKLEDSILKNMDRILKKPVFRGGTPWFTSLKGSDCNWLSIWWNTIKMRSFAKNQKCLSLKTWPWFSKNPFSGGGTPWKKPLRWSDRYRPPIWLNTMPMSNSEKN